MSTTSDTELSQDVTRARACMMPAYAPPPWVAHHGRGAWLWNDAGDRFLDFTGGIGVNALGHAHSEVVQAVVIQAARLLHTSNALLHEPGIALSERLVALSGAQEGQGRVFLTNSGTEATEAALKLARRYFADRGDGKRTRFVAAQRSFHGRSLGALSVTGQEKLRAGFGPLLEDVTFVPFGDADALREALSGEAGASTAALLLEPVQGNSGLLPATPGYLQAALEACREAGCLLVMDEIQTGLGRTGRWFGYQHAEGVLPDALILGKIVGGGLPLGALVTTRQDLGEVFQPGVHGSTFGGNPVACAAGLRTLDIMQREDLVGQCSRMGQLARHMLQALVDAHPSLVEVRGLGLMVGVRVDGPAKPIQQACVDAGLLCTVAGPHVVRWMPPFNVTEAELEHGVGILRQVLAAW